MRRLPTSKFLCSVLLTCVYDSLDGYNVIIYYYTYVILTIYNMDGARIHHNNNNENKKKIII